MGALLPGTGHIRKLVWLDIVDNSTALSSQMSIFPVLDHLILENSRRSVALASLSSYVKRSNCESGTAHVLLAVEQETQV